MSTTASRRAAEVRRIKRLTRLPRFAWVRGDRRLERMALERNFSCDCPWCVAARLRKRRERGGCSRNLVRDERGFWSDL
jgi:hypothetical protein